MEKTSNEAPDWVVALGVFVVGGLLLCIGLIAGGGWSWFSKMLESALPAWVQAIGSIGAIWATGRAVQRAHDLQERQRARAAYDEYTDLLEGVFQLVGGASATCRKMADFVADTQYVGVSHVRKMHSEILIFIATLESIEVTKLLDYRVVQAALVSRMQLPILLASLEKAITNVYLDDTVDATLFVNEVESAHEVLDPNARLLTQIIDQRRAVRP